MGNVTRNMKRKHDFNTKYLSVYIYISKYNDCCV
jgi:hypothetical protein